MSAGDHTMEISLKILGIAKGDFNFELFMP